MHTWSAKELNVCEGDVSKYYSFRLNKFYTTTLASSLAKGWRLILAVINALILLFHCTKGMECVVRVSSRWWGASLGPTLKTAARETKTSCIQFFLAVTVLNHQHMAHLAASLALALQPGYPGLSSLYGEISSQLTGHPASLKWDLC